MTTFPITTLPTDAPEWTLYDIDLSDDTTGLLGVTALGILKPLDARLYLRLNDCGSGDMTIPMTSPLAVQIGIGNFVALNYRGAYRGGFFVETRELVDVNSSEYSGLAVKFSGRGPLVLVDDAIVWDWWTPDIQNTRWFGVKNVMPDGGHAVPKGEIMFKLLDEAENYQTNPAGQHLKRYCWRAGALGDAGDPATPPIGEPLLTWDFDDTQDSLTNPWTDAEDMEFRVGTSLLEVLRQIAALEYDFTITREIPTALTGLFVLHAYATRVGLDRSSFIHFRVGMNCTDVSRKYNGAEIRNTILVEFSDPANPYTHVDDAAYILAHRRKESILQASNASNVATAGRFGQSELDETRNVKKDIAIKISDAVEPNIFIDYDIGDEVNYDPATGTETKYRILGAQLGWTGDQQYADVVIEFGDIVAGMATP